MHNGDNVTMYDMLADQGRNECIDERANSDFHIAIWNTAQQCICLAKLSAFRSQLCVDMECNGLEQIGYMCIGYLIRRIQRTFKQIDT